MGEDGIIARHGGYRSLKSFQIAQLIYDLTVLFCNRYVEKRSRTHDQMVQAARSGVQNIAEGSQASGTSKKTEMKLTSVARASLEELKLDYQDYLRQRGLPEWPPEHPALLSFKERRSKTLNDVKDWFRSLSVSVRASPCPSVPLANAALSLLNLACYLLDRQLEAQAAAVEKEGGFTENLYRVRVRRRAQNR